MIQSTGSNDFNGTFDIHKWSAPYYETPMEVMKALRDSECIGKTLRGVYAIGYAENIGHTDSRVLGKRMRDAGIELNDNWWNTYPHLKDIRVPWEVQLCEPIQFVFNDDSSLELLPIGNGGARIGVNSIPIGLENGLNRSNFCAGVFFAEVIGRKLSNIGMCVTKTSKQYLNSHLLDRIKPYTETSSEYCLTLSFGFQLTMEMVQQCECWYRVKLNDTYLRGNTPYSRFLDSERKTDEICIINGRDHGSSFWIVPSKRDDSIANPADRCDNFGISIGDYAVEAFLSKFLDKYFDPSIQDACNKHDVFDWYGGNLYSFESMKKILSDIRTAADLLRTDYSDPRIADIVSKFRFAENGDDSQIKEKDDKLRREYAEMVADFYQRFCTRVEYMMELPGYEAISFAGP